MSDEEKTDEEKTDEQENSESGKGSKDEVDYDKLAKIMAVELDKATGKEKADEKLFSQAELDTVVKTRLARAKSGSSVKNDAYDAQLKTANDQIEAYEKVLQKQVEAQLTNVPDSVKQILLKLTISEQLDWLADPENSINKRTKTPKTPQEARGTDSKELSEVRQIM